MIQKMKDVQACHWLVNANPGFLLAEMGEFSKFFQISNFSILLLLKFSMMMKQLIKLRILACGWSIEANPVLLLAEKS